MKKYVPSGYQIISIDATRVDDDGNLLEETEDEKVLYEICRSGKLHRKPILMDVHLGSNGLHLTGVPMIVGDRITVQEIQLEEGSISGYTQVILELVDDKILVTVEEQ